MAASTSRAAAEPRRPRSTRPTSGGPTSAAATCVALLLLAATCAALRPPQSGYLVTMPQRLQAGASQSVCIALYRLRGDRAVKLEFWQLDRPVNRPEAPSFLLFSASHAVPDHVDENGHHCFEIAVPKNITASRVEARVKVTHGLSVSDDFAQESHEISIVPYARVTLISTDKPRYQPGDQVFFRVVSLESDLRPVVDTVPEVWVTNPDGIRISQWKNVPTRSGLFQKHFQLAPETVLGNWNIHVKAADQIEATSFSVVEYVPSTFEIRLQVPKSITFPQKTLTVEVCAEYLFGRPVRDAEVTVVKTDYQHQRILKSAQTNETGCALLDLLIHRLSYRWSREVIVNVSVVDPATDTTRSKQATVTWQSDEISIRLEETSSYLKPKLPIFGRYIVTNEFGRPAVNETVQVCTDVSHDSLTEFSAYQSMLSPPMRDSIPLLVRSQLFKVPLLWRTDLKLSRRSTSSDCREFTSDGLGQVNFKLPSLRTNVTRVRLAAHTAASGSTINELTGFRSPSNTHIIIDHHHLPRPLPCSGDVTVHLLTSHDHVAPPPVYFQVMLGGRIVQSGEVENSTLTFHVPRSAERELKLLVHMVLDSSEVVADSRTFEVEECLPNQVSVSWDRPTAAPGGAAELTITGAANSVCAVGIVDKSTVLAGTQHQIHLATLTSPLGGRFSSGPHSRHSGDKHALDEKYCLSLQNTIINTLRRWGADDPDIDLGSIALLRHDFSPVPSPKTTRFRTLFADALDSFKDAGLQPFSNLGLENRYCLKEEVEDGARGRRSLHTLQHESFHIDGDVRDLFPETHLFSIETLSAEGTAVLTQTLPESATTWEASAVCVHPEAGLGRSTEATIAVEKLMLTKLTLPRTVKRGEVAKVTAAVLNFYDSSLSLHLTLAASDHYSLVNPSASYGIDFCVSAGSSAVAHFALTFSDLGEVDVAVTAQVKDGSCLETNAVSPPSDTVIRTLVVKPEGFPQETTTSLFVCLDPGQQTSVGAELPRPDSLIAGSERAFVSVYGDLVAPTIQNLHRLIQQPSGGGEPNMIEFVPNIHVRSYLEETGLLTDGKRQLTENNMRTGYQRQLSYRRNDGSYSSYGNLDPEPSLWLTAFVVKSFQEASQYIDIDESANWESAEWLLGQQQPDGCFSAQGDLLHIEMQGGTETGGSAALTAYVILALRDVVTLDRLVPAFGCLERASQHGSVTLFSEILTAYVHLGIGLDVKGKDEVDRLLSKATYEGEDFIHWKGARDTVYGGRQAVDLEMTSYMVLSLLRVSGNKYLQVAAKAVAWLNAKRNAWGSSESVQETTVTLQALTEFSKRTFSSNSTSRVGIYSDTASPLYLTVDSSNRLLLHQYSLTDFKLPSRVRFSVNGGCVNLRTVLRFSSTVQVPTPSFSLSLSSTARPSRHPESSYQLDICATYIRDSGQSQRAVLSVEIPSGYLDVADSLRRLRQNGVVRDYKVSENTVTFTLLKVTAEKTCVAFRIIREAEVENPKPSIVTVHDFYEPEWRARLEYQL